MTAVRKVLVTPEIASEMLKKNSNNREIKERTVNEYSRQMLQGDWMEENLSPLYFAKRETEELEGLGFGLLLNGQHRLNALIKAKKSYEFLLIEGCDPKIMPTIDMHAKRTSADVFKIDGINDPKLLASIVSKFLNCVAYPTGKNMSGRIVPKVSIFDIMNEYKRREKFWIDVADYVKEAQKTFKGCCEPSSIGAWYAMSLDINEQQAKTFFNKLKTGIYENEKEPGKLLRDFLLKSKKDSHRIKIVTSIKYGMFIKAWNYMRAGKLIKKLQFQNLIEDFPTMK